jgi:hypothetical protein
MNLTDEQKDLLKSVIAVYESGDKSQFIVVRTMTGSSLVCTGGHPSVEITADDADFEQLAREGLLTLTRNSEGSLCGKPTQAGIDAVKSNFATSPKSAEFVGDGDPGTIRAVVSFLERNNLTFEAKAIQHATQLAVHDGPGTVCVNVFKSGKIVVQGSPGTPSPEASPRAPSCPLRSNAFQSVSEKKFRIAILSRSASWRRRSPASRLMPCWRPPSCWAPPRKGRLIC